MMVGASRKAAGRIMPLAGIRVVLQMDTPVLTRNPSIVHMPPGEGIETARIIWTEYPFLRRQGGDFLDPHDWRRIPFACQSFGLR
jgi:hypothetical protein